MTQSTGSKPRPELPANNTCTISEDFFFSTTQQPNVVSIDSSVHSGYLCTYELKSTVLHHQNFVNKSVQILKLSTSGQTVYPTQVRSVQNVKACKILTFEMGVKLITVQFFT